MSCFLSCAPHAVCSAIAGSHPTLSLATTGARRDAWLSSRIDRTRAASGVTCAERLAEGLDSLLRQAFSSTWQLNIAVAAYVTKTAKTIAVTRVSVKPRSPLNLFRSRATSSHLLRGFTFWRAFLTSLRAPRFVPELFKVRRCGGPLMPKAGGACVVSTRYRAAFQPSELGSP